MNKTKKGKNAMWSIIRLTAVLTLFSPSNVAVEGFLISVFPPLSPISLRRTTIASFTRSSQSDLGSLERLKRRERDSMSCLASSSHNNDDTNNTYNGDREDEMKERIFVFNSILKEMRSSFQTVEIATFKLLSNQPVVAFAIFVVLGAFVAYLLGLVFLGGYISSGNPYENGAVPYWEEGMDIVDSM